MKLPICIYGDPVLRKTAVDITPDYPELPKLIADMFETLTYADGVGLAAPQIGLSIRVVVIDLTELADDYPEYKDFKKTYINAHILETSEDKVSMEEGCLSIPGVHEKVFRPQNIRVRYYDRQWNLHEETLSGRAARIFQHEYDHLEGVVFTDRLSALTKRVIQKRLQRIAHGEVHTEYAMHFPYRK